MDELKFYSVAEVATILSVSRRTVSRFIDAGELPARKIGKAWRISNADLEAFISSRKHN